ncbi:MAG: polyphenol oxidase family protein [Proteobacteria bacterium]|nr:polyphenol oxidase family protein [Pseudomonadota bacterium]
MTKLFVQSKMLCEAGFPLHGFAVSGDYRFDGPAPQDDVVAQYRALRAALDTPWPLLRLQQVHGDGVVDAKTALAALGQDDGWTSRPSLEGDALLSTGAEAVLGVLTADCLPILVACTDTGHVAAIHAGWRGLAAGVVRRTIRQLTAAGSAIDAMRCAIGPGICYHCYEVGDDLADKFPESVDPIGKNTGAWLLDLPNAAEVSLIGAGLSTVQIERLDICTVCAPEGLHSHRRDGDKSGRQLSFIAAR